MQVSRPLLSGQHLKAHNFSPLAGWNTSSCSSVWGSIQILFDNKALGRQTRGTAEHTPTTIRPATARFNGRDGGTRFERYQSPIVLDWGVTIQKVQGISLDKAVIDLGRNIFDHGHAYVALSRVRTLQGVMLVDLLRSSFDKNKKEGHEECARLAQISI